MNNFNNAEEAVSESELNESLRSLVDAYARSSPSNNHHERKQPAQRYSVSGSLSHPVTLVQNRWSFRKTKSFIFPTTVLGRGGWLGCMLKVYSRQSVLAVR